MTDKRLYTQPFQEVVQATENTAQSVRLLKEGILSSGPAQVENIGPDAPTRTLTAQFSGQYARLTALEYEELANASSIDVVPFYQVGGGDDPTDRYVAIQSADRNAGHPATNKVQRVDLEISPIGSKRSHKRAVRTSPTDVDTPFASAGAAEVVINAAFRNPFWWEPVAGTLESATIQRFEDGQEDDLAVLDATEPSFADPVLVYDIPYRFEYAGDVAVWDGRTATKTDADGNVQWQRVFSTTHDWVNDAVIETKQLRLRFEEGAEIEASLWNESNGAYETTSLGTSDWRLDAFNITRNGLERVDGYVRLFDTTNTSNKYTLNFSAKRGYDTILFSTRPDEGSVPQGVIDRLDPIAHESATDPRGDQDLVTREEVGL
jgi:hypothetical protein